MEKGTTDLRFISYNSYRQFSQSAGEFQPVASSFHKRLPLNGLR